MNLRCACGWTAGDWSEVSGHWATLDDQAGHNVHDVAAMSDESVLTALDRHHAREAADASSRTDEPTGECEACLGTGHPLAEDGHGHLPYAQCTACTTTGESS